MRLWHKSLISVLPRQQLLGQWRECCCIASNIAKNGNPNHILVDKIMDYNIGHFFTYSIQYVAHEMLVRGYKVELSKFWKHFSIGDTYEVPNFDELYKDWHNDRYYKQCYFNLEEKYDCGGITENEWIKIENNSNIIKIL